MQANCVAPRSASHGRLRSRPDHRLLGAPAAATRCSTIPRATACRANKSSRRTVSSRAPGSALQRPKAGDKLLKWRRGGTEQRVDAAVETTVDESEEADDGKAAVQSPAPSSTLQTLGGALLLVSPFFFWGTSMVSMKELALHTTPLAVSAWRLLPAGALVLAWALSTGRKQPSTWQAWAAIAAFGVVDGACFQGFLAEGLQRTSAGLGSIIIDSQPLTVAVLAALIYGESMTASGVAGLLVGIAGLCLLEVPPEAITSLVSGEGLSAPLAISGSIWDSGEWWMLLAAQSMAVGTVMVRWVSKYTDPVVATGWHMILGSIPLIILSSLTEKDDLVLRLAMLDGLDIANLLYVTLLGSAASYGVFFYNASKGNLAALSSLTFLTPMFAAGTGYLLLGETLTPLQLAGAVVTLGAVYLINSQGKE